VSGLILAGSAEFKAKLAGSDMFDPRLQTIVLKLVDVSYGGENGFSQAIELAGDCLQSVKFIREKKLLSAYFGEISKDSGRYCFGVKDTLNALDNGAVQDLIVYENLVCMRYELKHKTTDEKKIITVEEGREKDYVKQLEDPDWEKEVSESLLEWLALKFKDKNARLNFVTNKSQEGAQFCKGFGGIGGILRYQLDFSQLDGEEPEPDIDYDEFEDESGLGI
jgi:peptide chain release factor subunit 1